MKRLFDDLQGFLDSPVKPENDSMRFGHPLKIEGDKNSQWEKIRKNTRRENGGNYPGRTIRKDIS